MHWLQMNTDLLNGMMSHWLLSHKLIILLADTRALQKVSCSSHSFRVIHKIILLASHLRVSACVLVAVTFELKESCESVGKSLRTLSLPAILMLRWPGCVPMLSFERVELLLSKALRRPLGFLLRVLKIDETYCSAASCAFVNPSTWEQPSTSVIGFGADSFASRNSLSNASCTMN